MNRMEFSLSMGSAAGRSGLVLVLRCLVASLAWTAAVGWALAAQAPLPDAETVARVLAGLEATVPAGMKLSQTALHEYAREASAHWSEYERRIGTPMQKWARAEIAPAPGGTVFYPFAGPDFATVQRMYPDASRYVLVALQRAEPPPALGKATAEELSAFMTRFGHAWKQFAQIGFFRTEDLDEEAKKPGLRAGTTVPLMAFAVRSGFKVLSVEPVRLDAAGNDLEIHPGARSDPATWNSVRIALEHGTRRVQLDYVRMNLADASLKAHPAARAWIERMAANPTVLKAASHLPQSPRFSIVRNALLERAPSILQDETGIEYGALVKGFDVKLYGRFTKPHSLFNKEAQRALAQAYQNQQEPKPLSFRVSYQRQPEANLQFATRPRILPASHKP